MNLPLEGQTALVTGAARGLGCAIARRLAKEGAAVCVNYANSGEAAGKLVDDMRAAGGRAVAIRADIGDATQVQSMVARASNAIGAFSILVNNAGTVWRATLDTYEPSGMQRMRRTNVDGLIHATRAVLAGMKERRFGRIINITSMAALPGNAFYAATKAAVSIMTRRFAMELGQHGITVNAVAPGFILTELVREGRTEEEYLALLQNVSERSMVGRIGEPDDIANAVAFLASPASGFVTGQILTVDGGRMDYIGHP